MLYDAPGLYDMLFSERFQDVAWYRGLAQGAASVLELGAGTGRITLPLLDAGCAVTALEPSAAMRALLEARAQGLDAAVRARLTVLEGRAEALNVEAQFDRVFFAFNGLAHVIDREALRRAFAGIRARLKPEGLFAFDLWLPDPDILRGAETESARLRHPHDGRPCTLRERFRYEALRQVLYTEVTVAPVEGFGAPERYTLEQRMFYPEETLTLLEQAGLSLKFRSNRWSPFRPDGPRFDEGRPDLEGAMLAYVCGLA
ncbi:MAG: class I SAM-dependent methyltransferase [Myxococcales bacterium]|nr:class I SAM-dependent methyltransferase [Myxococcales bacterium]